MIQFRVQLDLNQDLVQSLESLIWFRLGFNLEFDLIQIGILFSQDLVQVLIGFRLKFYWVQVEILFGLGFSLGFDCYLSQDLNSYLSWNLDFV